MCLEQHNVCASKFDCLPEFPQILRDLQQTQNQCLERFTQCVIFTHRETGIASLGNNDATENFCSGYQLIKLLTVCYHL